MKLDELNTQKYALDAELLLYLSEIERRGLYREHACSSLFVFCVTRLSQSEDVAYKRVGAARLMLKYPEIYELLASGRIHLSGLMLLRPHLTPDNCQELLRAASGKSKRQIEELIAARFPQPDVPTTERRLPPSRARRTMADSPIGETTQNAAASKTHASSDAATEAAHTDSDAATVTTPASETAPRVPSTVPSPRVTSTSVDESVTARRVTATSVDESSIDEPSTIAAPTPSIDASNATARRVTSTSIDEPSTIAVHTASAQISATAPSGTAPSFNPATPSATAPSFGLATPSGTAPSANPATRARVDPLSGHSYRVTFTASERLKQKMDRARELLSHAISPSDLPALLERALDQLIEREERRRYGSTRCDTPKCELRESESPRRKASRRESSRREASECQNQERSRREASEYQNQEHEPRQQELPQQESHQHERRQHESLHRRSHVPCQKHAETPAELRDPDPISGTWAKPLSRHAPAAVRRAVWTRDAGQCTFEDRTGRRCEQRHFLELDHIEAFAIGGDTTVENLRLRCRAHNALEAEKLFGRKRIQRIIAHETQAR